MDDLPDDSLVGVLRFMKPLGAVRLLQVSRRWALRLRRRNDLWQMLCLERAAWRAQLPKRPRKPWVDIFLTMLRKEVEQQRKGVRVAWVRRVRRRTTGQRAAAGEGGDAGVGEGVDAAGES